MQKLVGKLHNLPFDPVLICGWRAFSMWIEIIGGTELGKGRSADGRGYPEFVQAAEAVGRLGFKISKETINTRSAMAWQVAEQRVLLVRNKALEPDELLIYDRRSLAQ